MKEPKAVSWVLTDSGIETEKYIYKHYPEYRKVILLNIFFTNPKYITKFQKEIQPTETFTFDELGSIFQSFENLPIVSEDKEDFLDDVISIMTKSKTIKSEEESE